MGGWWGAGGGLVEGWEVQLLLCFVCIFLNSVQVSFQDAESAAVEAAEAPEPRWM